MWPACSVSVQCVPVLRSRWSFSSNPWDRTKNYDRTGLETEYYDILGVKVPSMLIPVMPGRNLAVILETAAINNRQKEMGYNAAKELLTQLGLADDISK